MKRIKPSNNKHQWPRQAVPAVECRKRDLVIRIADWSWDKEEPAFEVEVYIGGVFDWHESESFTFHKQHGEYKTKKAAKVAASEYAAKQIAKLL